MFAEFIKCLIEIALFWMMADIGPGTWQSLAKTEL